MCLTEKATVDKKGKFKIATKCGIVRTPGGIAYDSSAAHIKKSCQGMSVERGFITKVVDRFLAGSLERLGVDCIDLYYLHRYDRKTPIEETMGAFKARNLTL